MRAFRVAGVLCLFLAAFPAHALVAGDVDGDGKVNVQDVQSIINAILGLGPVDGTDIDHSGNTNVQDVQLAINSILGFTIDSDGDGLCDWAENNLGTNPGLADSDGDGYLDGEEIRNGTDPLDNPQAHPPLVTSFTINNFAATTSSCSVALNNACVGNPTHFMASESAEFAGASWQTYSASPEFTLSSDIGLKTVYFKVRNAAGESSAIVGSIELIDKKLPVVTAFFINFGAASTTNGTVTLDNGCANSPTEFMASESPSFADASWQTYSASPKFILSDGDSIKTIYFKVRNADGESVVVSDSIIFGTPETPVLSSFAINNGAEIAASRTVTLNNACSGIPSLYMASESPSFAGAVWLNYNVAPSFTLSAGNGLKTIYFKTGNAYGESNVMSDTITLSAPPEVISFSINNGATSTSIQTVSLNSVCVNSPTEYIASESSNFAGASWSAYSDVPSFTLSSGIGVKKVYFKTRSAYGESSVASDTILLNASPYITAFSISNGSASTPSQAVTLNNTCVNDPTEYIASESSSFIGASWGAYSTAPSFTLSAGAGVKTVYFKTRNAYAESNLIRDEITLEPIVHRVNAANVSGAIDGLHWATAFTTIQEAIDAVASAGGGEVWVSKGTYTSTASNVVSMKPGVRIYGGFAGTENSRGERDWAANATVIDGEKERRCIIGGNNATIDGFIIRNGFTSSAGAGMYNNSSSPAISNCVFDQNISAVGGGIYNVESSPTISSCVFTRNTGGEGGGICNEFRSSPTISNCTFAQNAADWSNGGGIDNVYDSSPTLRDCTFTQNSAVLDGGGMANLAGCSPTLINCVFTLNTTGADGGGMHNYSASPSLTNCTFTQNSASYGGGMHVSYASAPQITNCIFWANSSDYGDSEISDLLPGEPFPIPPPSIPVVTYSCVQGGYTGEGNISNDPLLIGTRGANGRIRPTSPCIDAGTVSGAPATDIRGIARPHGAGVDMGAYELDDSDDDGISDSWERANFNKLTSASDESDYEGDGLTDLTESLYGADPKKADSDSDGLSDADELTQGWNPGIPTAVRRVNAANSSEIADGLSWATAFTAIQDAVDEVNMAGEGEVWVAAGTYVSTESDIVRMKPNANIYGGFAGTEADRESRDWAVNKTIVDGGGVRRCFIGANEATLDGFTIQNGSAGDGGGMYNYASSPTVRNCQFINNGANNGGGIRSYFSRTTVINCIFAKNVAVMFGAGISSLGSSTVIDCTFTQNTAAHSGGGISNTGATTLTNCTFRQNYASKGGSGASNSGSAKLTNCAFLQNSGGSPMDNDSCSPVLTNCTFAGNSGSAYGGSMYNFDSSPVITNCIFWSDSTDPDDVEIYCNNPSSPPPVITYSCVQGGYAGTGNIASDPLFMNAAGGDFGLQALSPCIDTGTSTGAPAADILGVTRPQGASVDIGAYEYAGK